MSSGGLLINTGTPDEPTESAIKCYLEEFLMDPIIIGAPYPIRKLIVSRICKTRPQQTVARYQEISSDDALVAYQSRFDSRKWLQPSVVSAVQELAAKGVRDVCVVCPVFTAENLETALEIDRDLRETFLAAAGPDACFTYVPCLDDDPGLIRSLADEVMEALSRV